MGTIEKIDQENICSNGIVLPNTIVLSDLKTWSPRELSELIKIVTNELTSAIMREE